VLSLVLGGARSGKSEVGERVAARLAGIPAIAGITYVATAVSERGDADFDRRIAVHRARRPTAWRTVELAAGESLSPALGTDAVVIVDSLGTWVAGHAGFVIDVEDLEAALERRREAAVHTVLVSDETGLGVHPETTLGLAFRDALGTLNRRLAAVADDVLLVVAGRVLVLPREEI
jgi:adenosyl cobinamide kinase/adenosyl cobinamide phosphate guanylyltransferase